MTPRFSPESAVRFDFATGVVASADGARRLLVPAELLLALFAEAPESARADFGHRLGIELGRRVAARLAAPATASVDAIVEHLGAELALTGLGSLRIERWGAALVFGVTSPAGDGAAPLIAAVLEGALQRLVGRDVALVTLGGGEGVRLVALSVARAAIVRGWLADGLAWGEALSRLQTGVVENG